jgi:threonylcarbamoyladenosine tRNA methylthiotransferase MtaB
MRNQKSAAFYTLGCKLNFSETSTIARNLKEAGYKKVEFHEPADIYVINTCSVTDNADKKCKKIVQQALKHSPGAYIAIIGCYAQLKPEEISQIPGVDLVLGANEKFNLAEHLQDFSKSEKAKIFNTEIKTVNSFKAAFSEGDRTRTFLKVQDGCDYFCSFCTIPLARGFSRSDNVANTVEQAKKAIEGGAKEIVLTGVNIGDFGKDTNESFFDLIKALDKLEGVERYRISSIEPNLLTNEIIEFVSKSDKFLPHFHIPLQSGSNKILKAMRRRYERELYAERVAFIKSLMPHAAIGVDVIVGFPSETKEDFIDTYEFINGLDVSYLHVFTYSERENTTALRIKEIVPMNERNERSKQLHILSEKKKRFFYDQNINKVYPVLFEAENDGGNMYGFTSNYIKVSSPYDPILVNEIKDFKLTTIDADGLMKGYWVVNKPITV